ncbi:MAG: hypothetical protein RL021_237, partial [Bacteroidota bacterium]
MENALKIYKSSAGSGKTFTLVKEYLRIVLSHPEEYRHILAITFTNKAAQEMKERVIGSLVNIASGTESDIRTKLEEELPGIPLPERAATVLTSILHDYPSFSISTIDSFFQKLLRALAREIRLPLRAELQLNQEDAEIEVTERLLSRAGKDKDLSGWLQKLVLKKLEEDRGWNLEKDIQWITGEIMKERGSDRQPMERDELNAFLEELKSMKKTFEASIRSIGQKALQSLDSSGYTLDDFTRGKSGPAGYLTKIADSKPLKDYSMNSYALSGLGTPENWNRKADLKDLPKRSFIEEHLFPLLTEAATLLERDYVKYLSSKELLRTLYLFGIINDLSLIFGEYRKENNLILISDTAKMLQEIITGDDTPFIYEKTGNRYKYLLIDEFQDTSSIQWNNLLPLVINSLGSGFTTLIVGDAKQSIYRWRGGDVQLLLKGIRKHLTRFGSLIKEDALKVNYRSKKEIVEFNNAFFHAVPGLLESTGQLEDLSLLQEAYGEGLKQEIAERNLTGGYVEWNTFFDDPKSAQDPDIALQDTDEDSGCSKGSWKEKSLAQTIVTVRDLLSRGFRHRDIAVLVRTNKEGNLVADHLFENGIEKIITPDSLSINRSPKVRFLINAFRLLADPGNDIARSQLLNYYVGIHAPGNLTTDEIFRQEKKQKSRGKNHGQPSLLQTASMIDRPFNRLLPAEFVDSLDTLARLPVYEVSEQLVRIFGFHRPPDAYVQRLQDLVLEFNTRHHASVSGFIDWWDQNERIRDSSVIIPENEDAIRIMSIHKSKGLQFPAVIMPFVEWKLEPKSGELIWVNSAVQPFDRLGDIGVYSGKALEGTVFNPDWQQERSQTVVDNVNMLYVAFTRAEEELYLSGPGEKGEGDINTASKLTLRGLSATGHLPDEAGTFRIGKKTENRISKADSGTTDELTSYPSNKWQDKIRIATRARRLSDLLKEKQDDRIRYGILVHDVIARILTKSDVDREVDRYFFGGDITAEQQQELKALILEVMEHPLLSDFFDETWDIRRE